MLFCVPQFPRRKNRNITDKMMMHLVEAADGGGSRREVQGQGKKSQVCTGDDLLRHNLAVMAPGFYLLWILYLYYTTCSRSKKKKKSTCRPVYITWTMIYCFFWTCRLNIELVWLTFFFSSYKSCLGTFPIA